MLVEFGCEPKYENMRNHAHWAKVGIDTPILIQDHNIHDYCDHLRDCYNKPTVGMIVRREYLTEAKKYYPMDASSNLYEMHMQPEVDSLVTRINEKIRALYPKTKKVRQYIIDTEKVKLDEIVKAKKCTLLDKIRVAIKSFGIR